MLNGAWLGVVIGLGVGGWGAALAATLAAYDYAKRLRAAHDRYQERWNEEYPA